MNGSAWFASTVFSTIFRMVFWISAEFQLLVLAFHEPGPLLVMVAALMVIITMQWSECTGGRIGWSQEHNRAKDLDVYQ